MNPTLGSLFDGIAGFPYAASLEGITPVWASEIEPFPMSVSARHFPNMKQLGDVTKINGAEIEPVDIITFGSPCQDLSVAGKRAGFDGARSGLFMEAVRIIEEMRTATNGLYPRYAIWENVPGAFSSNGGRDFRAAVGALVGAEVPMPLSGGWATAGMVRGNGRSVAWRVFDAQYWGVPQRRRRIFLIADFRGQRAPEILFEREGVSGDTEAGRSEGEGVAGGIEGGAGGVLSFNLRGREGGAMPEVDPDSLANIRAAGGG
jgi:DNA (cytosine-5)-methyltransferase 1